SDRLVQHSNAAQPMSAMGHSRRFERSGPMTAIAPITTKPVTRHDDRTVLNSGHYLVLACHLVGGRANQMTPTTPSQRNASDAIVSCMSAMTIHLPYCW